MGSAESHQVQQLRMLYQDLMPATLCDVNSSEVKFLEACSASNSENFLLYGITCRCGSLVLHVLFNIELSEKYFYRNIEYSSWAISGLSHLYSLYMQWTWVDLKCV